jgi:hypothetical protein
VAQQGDRFDSGRDRLGQERRKSVGAGLLGASGEQAVEE